MNNRIVVIGAANIDIGGTPYSELISADSNPGVINISYGGVGRNIAHNLTLLDMPVSLITAAGNDALGREMILNCKDLGMDVSNVFINEGQTSPMYIYINDNNGDMALALSHIKLDSITPDYIDSLSDVINDAAMAVVDANISEYTFIRIKEVCKVPLLVDPVSVSHAFKIRGHLGGTEIIKPNRLEAELLTGISIDSLNDAGKAALDLIRQGVRKVFISMGSMGIVAAENDDVYHISRCDTHVSSTTGAGDSASAAIVWAYNSLQYRLREQGYTGSMLIPAAKSANAAASMTISSRDTISDRISQRSVLEKITTSDMKVTKL